MIPVKFDDVGKLRASSGQVHDLLRGLGPVNSIPANTLLNVVAPPGNPFPAFYQLCLMVRDEYPEENIGVSAVRYHASDCGPDSDPRVFVAHRIPVEDA